MSSRLKSKTFFRINVRPYIGVIRHLNYKFTGYPDIISTRKIPKLQISILQVVIFENNSFYNFNLISGLFSISYRYYITSGGIYSLTQSSNIKLFYEYLNDLPNPNNFNFVIILNLFMQIRIFSGIKLQFTYSN